MGIRGVDFPTKMTDRFQRIFLEATDNEESRTSNCQTLMVLGGFAMVTGLVGTVASYYFQSSQYLPECLGNMIIGAVAIKHGLRGNLH